MLLFGGRDAGGLPDDTWAWDGAAWAVVREHGPPGRTVHALAFDATRGRLILHGGADRVHVLDDPWELADGGWTRLAP